MTDTVSIRELHKGEESDACQLIVESFNEFIAPGYSDEGVHEFLKYVTPEFMQERLEHESFALVAIADDLMAGMIEVRSNNHISLLYVKKEYHRRGIARKLVESAIERCRQKDNTLAEIDVKASPYAVRIYEKLGFITTDAENTVNGVRFTPMKSVL
jgi:ribosomal protein S18 acetylase RimI-like enzyme